MPAARRPSIPRRSLVLVLTLAAGAAGPSILAGQDSTAVAPGGEWRVGGSIGLPGIATRTVPAAITVGMHFTRLPVGPIGADFSIGTAPYSLTNGVLTVGARAGLTYPLRDDSGLILLPTAGVSYVGAAAGSGTGGAGAESRTGVHIGAATVATSGLRLGLTLHWLGHEPRPVWLFELGVLRPR